ncbi:MAG TPA: hypothetical protein VII94_01430 [Candidatus Saccharimonadales bacterium]
MTYLPNLIKRIDEFYKLAAPPYATYTSPDEDEDVGDTDSGLYSMIVNKARDIETGNVRNDVLLIAELYKKALEMNAGFSTIDSLNSDLLSNLNCDTDEEQDAVEALLLDIGKDVRKRAQQSGNARDSEGVMRALQEVKNNFEDGEEPPEDEPAGLEKFDERAKVVFDPTAGLAGARGDKSINRGNRLIVKRTPKDWLELFQAEKQQAERDLSDPELNILRTQRGSQRREIERNSKEIRKDNLKELIVTLTNLSDVTFRLLKVQDKIQEAPDDEQLKKLLPTLEEQEDALGKKRTLLKTRLRDHLQASKAQETQQKVNEVTDPKAKKYFEELLALQNLKRDKGVGRSEEIFWRQKLVNALATKDIHGDLTFQNLNPQTLSSMEAKIQEGKTNRKTRQELSRHLTEQRSKLRGVEEAPLTKEQIAQKRLQGIRIKRKSFDFTKMQFDNLCEQYREKLATARTVAKQAVSHEMIQVEGKTKKYHNDLKPYLDRVAKAVDSRDSSALQKATQELNEQTKNFVHKSPVIKAYVWHTRYNKPLSDLKNQVNAISPLLEKQELDSNDLNAIDSVIKRGDALIKHYANNYPPSMGEGGVSGSSLVNRRGWSFIYYDTSIKILKELVSQLKSIVGEEVVQ